VAISVEFYRITYSPPSRCSQLLMALCRWSCFIECLPLGKASFAERQCMSSVWRSSRRYVSSVFIRREWHSTKCVFQVSDKLPSVKSWALDKELDSGSVEFKYMDKDWCIVGGSLNFFLPLFRVSPYSHL
jgi:hypothetical protein